jgi:hypothetical protein
MRITLKRTGGIIPITKKAEKEVDWSEEEVKELLHHAKADEGPGESRDSTAYQLMVDAAAFSINLEKIPKKFLKVFEDLKDNLKIEKR